MNLLDNDFYAFTMSYWAWLYNPEVEVKYKFLNRSGKPLRFDHLDWLENWQLDGELPDIFSEYWLKELKDIQAPKIWADQEAQTIEYWGPWWQAIFMEAPLLANLNQTRTFYELSPDMAKERSYRLEQKIDWLKRHPYIKFFEFGTRRRSSPYWQHQVIARLLEEVPQQLLGTSNVSLANEFGIEPVGTMAHQIFMVQQALDMPSYRPWATLDYIIQTWKETFPYKYHILLTDTFGTDWLLRNLLEEQLMDLRGFRQDSGDPLEWGYKIARFLDSYGIDPKDKLLVFSDGLDPDTMLKIYREFSKFQVAFGWGTNLTNDTPLEPLSMVVKPWGCRRDTTIYPCVKLSDNLAKASGPEGAIAEYKKIFGYQNNFERKPVY